MNFEDLSGARFGELVVVKRVDDYIRPNGKPATRYLCVCSCGNVKVVRADFLRNSHTGSCGKCKGERTKKEREQEKQAKAAEREAKRAAKKTKPEKCCYHPKGVICDEIQCFRCGWNPFNKSLRQQRVEKVIARREKNGESSPTAEDS